MLNVWALSRKIEVLVVITRYSILYKPVDSTFADIIFKYVSLYLSLHAVHPLFLKSLVFVVFRYDYLLFVLICYYRYFIIYLIRLLSKMNCC